MKLRLRTKILLALAVLVAALLLGRNLLLQAGIPRALKAALGLELEIARMHVGLFESRIRIEGLKVMNPPGFGAEPLAVIPLIDVDYELGSMFSGKLHCTAIEVDVQEVRIVKDAQGEVNLNHLTAVGGEKAPAGKEAPAEPAQMQIDRLTLTVGTVHYVTLKKDGTASTKTMGIGLDHEVFENLRSPQEVIRVVVLRVLRLSGLEHIGVAVDALKSGLSHIGGAGKDLLEGVGKSLKEGAGKLKEGAGGLLDRLRGK